MDLCNSEINKIPKIEQSSGERVTNVDSDLEKIVHGIKEAVKEIATCHRSMAKSARWRLDIVTILMMNDYE